MPDDMRESRPNDALARAFVDLEAFAACDLVGGETAARAERLCGSLGLAELLALARRGALVDVDDEQPAVPEDWPPGQERDEPGRDHARARAIDDAGDAVRRTIEARATTAGERHAPTILIADSGRIQQRRLALAQIAAPFLADLAIIDATHDPFLMELNGPANRVVAVMDGDLAPALGEALERSPHRAAIVMVPRPAIRLVGERLVPDLVLPLPAAHSERRQENAPHVDSVPALATALDLVPDGAMAAASVPRGPALIRLLRALLVEAPPDQVMRTLRRLAVTGFADDVRNLLSRLSLRESRLAPREPHHVLAWNALYRGVGLPEPARELLTAGKAAFPDDPRVRHAWAMNLLTSEVATHRDQALGELRQLLDHAGHGEDHATAAYAAHALGRAYRRAGQRAAARATIEEGLAWRPANLHLQIEAGIIASLDGRHEEAEAIFSRAHRSAPACGAVLNAWALAVARTGWADRAARMLQRARNLEPWNERHWLELATLAKNRGLITDAETIFQAGLASHEPAVRRRTHLQLADLYVEAERWPEAEQQLAALDAMLADLHVVDAADHAREATVRAKLLAGQGEIDRALELLVNLGNAEVNDHVRTMRARLRLDYLEDLSPDKRAAQYGWIDEITRDVQALPTTGADFADARTVLVMTALRARLWALQGRWADARALLEDELEQAPHLPPVLNTLATFEWRAARESEEPGLSWRLLTNRALTYARCALDVDPRNAYTHRVLAQVLSASGAPDDAERHRRYLRLVGLPEESRRQAPVHR